MPKSKPDMVHSVRIELQEKERELLEKYMEAKTVEGYAKAVNNAMIPVGVVFIGGVAYLIADGIHDFWEKHRDRLSTVYERTTDPSFEQAEKDTGQWWRVFDIQYILGIRDKED
jgi:hypothetical protein